MEESEYVGRIRGHAPPAKDIWWRGCRSLPLWLLVAQWWRQAIRRALGLGQILSRWHNFYLKQGYFWQLFWVTQMCIVSMIKTRTVIVLLLHSVARSKITVIGSLRHWPVGSFRPIMDMHTVFRWNQDIDGGHEQARTGFNPKLTSDLFLALLSLWLYRDQIPRYLLVPPRNTGGRDVFLLNILGFLSWNIRMFYP